VVDPQEFEWTDDNWKGIPKSDLVIYELHVGTFTEIGTFESMVPVLPYLRRELGISAIELMPVGQFPGGRNWGYDGVLMYAVQNSYGGPDGLKKLADSCHAEGLGLILDVVYNHLGPEGNYLPEFGPYMSSKYHTPWGETLNYDDSGSDEVRHYVIGNALHWISEYHVDGLRLDAVHGIYDFSPHHLLQEMSEQTHELAEGLGRKFHFIAESDLNDPLVVEGKEKRGYLCDAQWSDDFHHAVHAYLTGERQRHYADFGNLEDISKSMKDTFVYDGKYSQYRERTHGAPVAGLSGDKFVVFMQNHDQVGNRAGGERLSTLISPQKLKIAAALCILSCNIPLLFMGEEYGEKSPFYYFIDHSDKKLVEAVRRGRRRDLGHGKLIDPQSPSTFIKSKVNPDQRSKEWNKQIFEFYQELIALRKSHKIFSEFDRSKLLVVTENEANCIVAHRTSKREEILLIFSFASSQRVISNPFPNGNWMKILDTSSRSKVTIGEGERSLNIPPTSVIVYTKSD
jgi:maltooligosyltrehalose trehalohydrolase